MFLTYLRSLELKNIFVQYHENIYSKTEKLILIINRFTKLNSRVKSCLKTSK